MLRRFRDLILNSMYVVTVHAYDEMAPDDLTIWDVESAVLTGEIIERQKDAETSEWKYRVRGTALDGRTVEVVVKQTVAGKLLVITVYVI